MYHDNTNERQFEELHIVKQEKGMEDNQAKTSNLQIYS